MDTANQLIVALTQPQVAALIGVVAIALSGFSKDKDKTIGSGVIILIAAAIWAMCKYKLE